MAGLFDFSPGPTLASAARDRLFAKDLIRPRSIFDTGEPQPAPSAGGLFGPDTNYAMMMAGLGLLSGGWEGLLPGAMAGMQIQGQQEDRRSKRASEEKQAAQQRRAQEAVASILNQQGRSDLAGLAMQSWDMAKTFGDKLAGGMQNPDRFEVKQGDAIKTFVGIPSDPKTWREVATAPREGQQGASETERRIARMMNADPSLSYSTAVAIADGRFVASRDPISGTSQIVDKATGRVVGSTTANATTAPPASAPRTSVPGPGEGADYQGAVGARGFFTNLVNTVSDAIGMGTAFPGVERATQAFNNLQTQTMLQLAEAFPGRPSNLVREELRGFAVQPNSLFQGEARAGERLQQTRRYIDIAIQAQSAIVDNAGQHTPQQVADARQKLVNLRDLGQSYDAIIRSFGGDAPASAGSTIQPPPASYSGPPELWQHMTPEERALWK